jgi:hypothetical protein
VQQQGQESEHGLWPRKLHTSYCILQAAARPPISKITGTTADRLPSCSLFHRLISFPLSAVIHCRRNTNTQLQMKKSCQYPRIRCYMSSNIQMTSESGSGCVHWRATSRQLVLTPSILDPISLLFHCLLQLVESPCQALALRRRLACRCAHRSSTRKLRRSSRLNRHGYRIIRL